MTTGTILLGGALGLAVFGVIFLYIYAANAKANAQLMTQKRKQAEQRLGEMRKQSEDIIKKALREAKHIALQENRELEKFQKEKNQELKKLEERISKREESMDKKSKQLDVMESELKARSDLVEKEYKRAQDTYQKSLDQLENSKDKLEKIAGLSAEEAREELQKTIEVEARKAAAAEVKAIEEETRKVAEDRARSLIATSIQRIANEFVTDATVSVINLPSDDMKGRIIGREGRNIRAIEQATGVDLIIDDTPEAVIISCFNPVRREIAKMAIERLIVDGRIHPARIDEIVQKTKSEFENMIREIGERSAFDCGITNLHEDLTYALGKLKYMSSGGVSVLQHSVETANIAGILAAELGLNVNLTRRAALLHDIGKSMDETFEGSHSHIGAQLLQKYSEPPEVIEAAAKHHQENMQNVNPIAVLVQAANTLSHFRPGARKEFIEKTVGRLQEMESAVESFEGVEQAFVIRSGKEIRALVSPKAVSDAEVSQLAKTVAKQLKAQAADSQSQIKVTLVREQRATAHAK